MRAVRTAPSSEAASAARAGLAEVVARLRDAREGAEALERAGADAARAVWAAEARVGEAHTAVDAAKGDAVTHLQARAMGAAGEAPRSIRRARDDLRDAQDDLAAATEARDALKARQEQLRRGGQWSGLALDQAVRGVLAAEAGEAALALALDVAGLQRELTRKALALKLLVERGALPRRDPPFSGELADERAQAALGRLRSPPDSWRELRAACGDLAALWDAAIGALGADAAAPLPAGEP